MRPVRVGGRGAGWLWVVLATWVPTASAQEMELPRPTPEHGLLKKDLGTWDATIKVWMGPGDPVESKGVETNTMLGDLWLISAFEGEVGGLPFKGHGQYGYDPLKRRFVITWVDTFTTSPTILEGTHDEKSGELTLTGETTGPDGTKAQMKNVSKHNPDGTRVTTFYMKGEMTGGEWVKSMEIHYRPRRTAER
jgi:hypothetical protein